MLLNNFITAARLTNSRLRYLVTGFLYSNSYRMVHLKVTPRSSLMDSVVKINISDLAPSQPITLAALLQEEGDVAFVSYGHYTANQQGSVDITAMESHGGTYSGCEPMGLFWSMKAEKEFKKSGLRLRKKDVTQPHTVAISVLADHIDADTPSSHTENVLAKTCVERAYMTHDVIRIPVKEGHLRGTIFLPNGGNGEHPGVIDMYGTTGGLVEYRAALLASHGFTTLALAYFGYDDLPKIMELQLEYFEEAIDWFSQHANVCKEGIGTIGISKGSEFAIMMATMSKKVKAVAAINSYHYLSTAQHYYRGKEIPTVYPDFSLIEIENGSLNCLRAYREAENIENCLLPVEKATQAKFLFLHGAEDQLCDSICGAKLASRMREHNLYNYALHIYPGTGHLLEPPYIPTCSFSMHKLLGHNIIWGGKIKDHAHAQADAWDKILKLFQAYLPLSTIKAKL